MRRTALLLVALLTLFGCTSAENSTATTAIETTTTSTATTTTDTATPTTTTTMAPTTTTSQPATTDTKEVETFPGSGDTAYLTSVDVTDDATITFAFEGETTPAYRVAYVEPPIVADGSGMELDLGGDAFLQVVVTPGAGVDLSGDEARETFTGPDRFTVEGTDHVVEVAETGDFESVLTWTIGLDATHPFTVEATPGTLVVDIIGSQTASASLLGADPATCSSPDGFSVSYPSHWWASSGELACGSFAPTELNLTPGTDVTAPVMIFVDPVDFRTAAAPGEASEELDRAVSTLDGHRAVRTVSTVDEGLYPSGTEVTTYIVEFATGDDAQTLIATTADLESYAYERNVKLLDEMFRTIELDQSGPEGLVASYRGGGTPFDVIAEPSNSEVCLTVDPGDLTTCLDAPAGNRVDAALVDDVLVGLAGPDVFRIEVEGGISFLPVPIGSATSAWAVPFDGSDFNVLGTDGDTILIEQTA